MLDQAEAVADRDSQHRDEAKDGAERQVAAEGECRQRAAGDGRGQRQEQHGRQAPASDARLQDEENADRGGDCRADRPLLGGQPSRRDLRSNSARYSNGKSISLRRRSISPATAATLRPFTLAPTST